jgi:S-adenosyl methyltransferase
MTSDPAHQQPALKIDTSVPNSARVWNYWLGGKDHYQVDREAGDEYVKTFPGIVDIARTSRYFMTRAVRFLAAGPGIRQFLDVGAGLPTVDNTHEVAQRVAADARIAYVDNDALVLAHARALMTSSPGGVTGYIDADMHEPGKILDAAARMLDLTRPVALMMIQALGHVAGDDEAASIVRALLAGLPAGSYLVLSDGVDVASQQLAAALRGYNDSGAATYKLRFPGQVARFFDGLDLAEPGLVRVSLWRPEVEALSPPAEVETLGGVGRKP